MTPTSRQDLSNATAAIGAAISALKLAEPVMMRFLGEAPTDETRAVGSIVTPIFRAAAKLLRVHEFQMRLARAALEKVTAK
jgi:hypothetical protein